MPRNPALDVSRHRCRWGPRPLLLAILALLLAPASFGQSSTSYQISGSTFNNGGDPNQGSTLASAGYRIRFDAIGDLGSPTVSASSAYSLETGFTSSWRAPGEVLDLRFAAKATLAWSPEGSIGRYNLYRGDIAGLASGYGACRQPGLTAETATESVDPPAGETFFFLVTAENRLDEEGTLGWTSTGLERANTNPCP